MLISRNVCSLSLSLSQSPCVFLSLCLLYVPEANHTFATAAKTFYAHLVPVSPVLKATELFLLVKMCQAPYFQTQGRSGLSTDTWDEGKSKGFLPGIRWSILHNAL